MSRFSKSSYFWILFCKITKSCSAIIFNFLVCSSNIGTTSSAAAEGVGARKSATKSAMVKSISCPTADTTGRVDLEMARATISSLKAHKSSIEPPPLPTMRTSKSLILFICWIASDISSAEPSPWTFTG